MIREVNIIEKAYDKHGEPCPSPTCTSSDGFKRQDNGWGHCFKCGFNEAPEGLAKKPAAAKPVLVKPKRPLIPMGEVFQELPDRKISKATCEKYKIWRVGDRDYFANFKEGKHLGTKWRNLLNKKDQLWTGEQNELFGQHLFPAGCAPSITVTEGEYDAASAYEMLGSKWPAVSVINGTGTALQDVKNNYEYLNSFDKIVLSFDNDEAGRKVAKDVAALFPASKVRIYTHREHKDASDFKVAGDGGAYTKGWWNAPAFMPDGLKFSSSLRDSVINRPLHFTTLYPWTTLNKMTYGCRLSEAVLLMADTGLGKTSILREVQYKIAMDSEIREKGYKLGVLHLEEPNHDTALGYLSIHNNKPYHLPDTEKTEEELNKAFDEVLADDRFICYDHFGSNKIDVILDKIRHMVVMGCKYIFIDHLSIIVSDQAGDERKQLDEISTKLKTLTMELNIAVFAVIHTNREGQVRGSAGPEQLANIHLSLHRNKKEMNEWRRNVTKIVVEKNRFCGRTGPCSWLYYDSSTGRLSELTPEEIEIYEAGDYPKDYQIRWQ